MKLTEEYIHAIGEALRHCYKQDPTIFAFDGKTEINYSNVYDEWNGKQILDDYEKARKWDEDQKRDVQTPKENQKLRELIEKRIEELMEKDRANQRKNLELEHSMEVYDLQKLLEESKK